MVNFNSKKTIFILTALLLVTAQLFSQQLLVGNDKIVKVNNKIITIKELKERHEQMKMVYVQAGQTPLSEKEVLKTMIDAELLKAAIKNSNMVADEGRLKQQIDMMKMQFTQYMLRTDPNFKYDDDKFKKYLETESSYTYAEFEENMRMQVLQEQYVQKRAQTQLQALMSKNYPDSEIRAIRQQYLSEFVMPQSVTVKHIFFQTIDETTGNSVSATEKERMRKKALDVLGRLKKGESFETLCEFNSDDDPSRDFKDPKTGNLDRGFLGPIFIGGRYGEQARQQFGDATVTKIFGYKAGSYSEVLEGPFGYHIFKIIKHEPEKILSLEEAKPQIVQMLRMRDQQQIIASEYAKIIEELRKKADIKYYKEEYRQ